MPHALAATFAIGLAATLTTQTQKAAATPPINPAVACLISEGREALDRREPEEAVKLFRKASKTSRDKCVECRIAEANALVQLGAPGAALKSARKALSTATNDAERASAHGAIGDALVSTERNARKIDLAPWRRFVADKDMIWEHYWDRDRSPQRAYGVRGIPTHILIDPEGIIRERIVGLDPQSTVVNRLKKALAAIDMRK